MKAEEVYGVLQGEIDGLTNPLVSVTPNADKTKADYEYADGTIIRDVPLAPEASEAKIEKVVDEKLVSIKSEFDGKLATKVSKADLDGTSVYYGDDNKVHAVGDSADTSELERKVDKLYKLTQGQIWDFEQRTESGTNNAPSGAKYMSILSAEGKTEQKTYQGSNIFERLAQKVTVDGITVEPLPDGGYHVFGTNTNSANITIWAHDDATYRLPRDYYYLSAKGFSDDVYCNAYYLGDIKTNITNSEKNMTVEGRNYSFIINVKGNATVDTVIYLSLSKAVGAPFEPYVGGIPSPNPEYPQDIVGVEEINVSVDGRQLLNKSYTSATSNGVTFTWDSPSSGKAVGTNNSNSSQSFSSGVAQVDRSVEAIFLPRGIYTFKGVSDDNNMKFQLLLSDNAEIGFSSSTFGTIGVGVHRTVTIDSDMYAIARVIVGIGVTVNASYKIMLEHGAIVHDYEPYIEPQTRKIIPPSPLHKIGEYADVMDVAEGVWRKNTSKDFATKGSWNIDVGTQNYGFTKYGILSNRVINTDIGFFSHGYVLGGWQKNGMNAGFANNSKALYISVPLDVASTVAEFDAWIEREHPYVVYVIEETTSPINASDLSWLRSLDGTSTDKHITITDQDGNDVSWVAEYIVKLNEVVTNSEGE